MMKKNIIAHTRIPAVLAESVQKTAISAEELIHSSMILRPPSAARSKQKILVTRSFLPDKKKYSAYLDKIWSSGWLTNNGALVQELEKKLKDYFGVKHLFLVSNGTIALQLAINALKLRKKIITTPFSFIATSSAILWQKCEPVFVDVEEGSFCIDAKKIEKAITPDTEAILAVHVYGSPCRVKEIERIARKHNLKVIYDAAHAFGVRIGERSVMEFGDISIISFHATKLFHTGEGGAVATNDDDLARRLKGSREFGYEGDNIEMVGINGKMSEFHAAMGLCVLEKMPDIFSWRKDITRIYDKNFADTPLRSLETDKEVLRNYAYYPIVFENESDLLRAKQRLEEKNIFPRRYFQPSLNTLSFVEKMSCPVSESLSQRVMCLPLYYGLGSVQVREISKIIIESLER